MDTAFKLIKYDIRYALALGMNHGKSQKLWDEKRQFLVLLRVCSANLHEISISLAKDRQVFVFFSNSQIMKEFLANERQYYLKKNQYRIWHVRANSRTSPECRYARSRNTRYDAHRSTTLYQNTWLFPHAHTLHPPYWILI